MNKNFTNFNFTIFTPPFYSKIILAILVFGFYTPKVHGHTDDERSHQVITFQPNPSGGNIILEIFCDPKLSQSVINAFSSANTMDPKDIRGFNRLLIGLQPWLSLTLVDLRKVLEIDPEFLPPPPPFSFQLKETPLSTLHNMLDKKTLYRHYLFMQLQRPTPARKPFVFYPELKLIGGKPRIGGYLPSFSANINTGNAELLKLEYQYEWTWPNEYHRHEGLTGNLETYLKNFTSNSVFHLIAPSSGSAKIDQLNLEAETIKPEEFMNQLPSDKFKVRKALFYYQWP